MILLFKRSCCELPSVILQYSPLKTRCVLPAQKRKLFVANSNRQLVYAAKDPNDIAAAIAAARSIQDHDLSNPKLRNERIGNVASKVSAIPEVREALLEYQREFAKRPGGAVLDGRDIGTVICPDAAYKFFITASIDARTTRRHKQLTETGFPIEYDAVKDDLISRDKRDAERSVAPLKPADDAMQIDTTPHSANDVFAMVVDHITEKSQQTAD